MTAAPPPAARHQTSSPAWAEFSTSPRATAAVVGTLAALALMALQFRSGIQETLVDEVRTGQMLLVVLAAIAAYMLWSPSLGGGGSVPEPVIEPPVDRLHALVVNGHRVAEPRPFESVRFGSGQAWVRARR
jgi:hypothetical protein